MTPEQHKHITKLFHALRPLSANERAEVLTQHPEWRDELESLFEAENQLGDFIEAPALSVTAEWLAAERSPLTCRKRRLSTSCQTAKSAKPCA